MSLHRRLYQEEGVALVFALLGVIILAGVAVVMVARATTESRASAFSRDFETTIHSAEAAADLRIAAMNADPDHVTLETNDVRVLDQEFGSEAEERAWVLEQLDDFRDVDGVWFDDGIGESYAFRPASSDPDAEPLDVIYAAGASPAFDGPQPRIRVIKLQLGKDLFNPRVALLAGGSLVFGGSASVVVPGCQADGTGCVADVHVNGSLTNPGNASYIEGEVVVAGGTCPSSMNSMAGCVDASVGAAPIPIPEMPARNFYIRGLDPVEVDALSDVGADPASLGWYDLCPDGTIRAPSTSGPCASGTIIWGGLTGDPSTYLGWDFRSAQNEWRASALQSGTFYVYGADANVTGTAPGEQTVSILVEGLPTNLTRSGSLSMSGNPRMNSAIDDVLIIVDRDLKMMGTPTSGADACAAMSGSSLGGFIGVGEQLDVAGNVRVQGAVIVRDAVDQHNLVSRNNASVSGNMCLQYDPQLAINLSGIWVVRYWNEL